MISRFAIVTDWTVGKLVGGILRDAFLQSNISVLYKEIEPGEDSKSRDTKGMLEDWLAQNGYGRDSCLIGEYSSTNIYWIHHKRYIYLDIYKESRNILYMFFVSDEDSRN